jgi:hypothetical protein
MNAQMFYKGLLCELSKQADYSTPSAPPAPAPAKPKSIFSNPLFWGGLGVAGLGGYGLYRSLANGVPPPNIKPPPTSTSGSSTDSKAGLDPAPSTYASQDSPSGYDKVTSTTAKGALGAMLGGQALGGLTRNLVGSPGLSRVASGLSQGGAFLAGASNLADSLNPNNTYANLGPLSGKATRSIQGVGGVAEMGLSIAPSLGPAAAAAAGSFALPLAAAYGTGLAGQMALEHAGDRAVENSDVMSSIQNIALKLRRGMLSNDPSINAEATRLARTLFSDPKTRGLLDKTLNPGWFTRLGYWGNPNNESFKNQIENLKWQLASKQSQ